MFGRRTINLDRRDLDLVSCYKAIAAAPTYEGHQLLLLLLVRDADRKDFYADLVRYWDSLEAITNRHIFLLVADAPRRRVFDTFATGYNWICKYAAIPPRHKSLVDKITRALENPDHKALAERAGDATIDIGNANSGEVYALASHLGVNETELPSFHLTLLTGEGGRAPTLNIPMASCGNMSAYAFCKSVQELMQSEFAHFDDVRTAYSAAYVARQAQGSGEASILEWSKAGVPVPFAQSEACRAAWLPLREAFRGLSQRSDWKKQPSRWHYFISYPASDRPLAEAVAAGLVGDRAIFLDNWCLRPGSEWADEIPIAQSQSEATVALITANTKDAYFQKAEIQRAINLKRQGQHQLLPIVVSPEAELPFGVELVQNLTWDGAPSTLPGLCQQIARATTI